MNKFVGYVKRNPMLFGVTAVIFIVILFVATRKGGGHSGDQVTTVSSGPTDAQVQAQAALAAKQIDAQAQIQLGGLQIQGLAQQGQNDLALATVGAQVSLADLAAQERLGDKALDAQREATRLQLETQSHIVDSNNQFQIDYATIAKDSALQQVKINAELTSHLADQQLKAYEGAAVLSVIPTLKKRDRAYALATVTPSILN